MLFNPVEKNIIKISSKWREWFILKFRNETTFDTPIYFNILWYKDWKLGFVSNKKIYTNLYEPDFIEISKDNSKIKIITYLFIWGNNESRFSCHNIRKNVYQFQLGNLYNLYKMKPFNTDNFYIKIDSNNNINSLSKIVLKNQYVSLQKYDLLNWLTWYHNLWKIDWSNEYCKSYAYDKIFDFKNEAEFVETTK